MRDKNNNERILSFLDEEAGSHKGPRVQRLRGEGRLQCQAVHRLQGQGGQDPDNPGGEDRRWCMFCVQNDPLTILDQQNNPLALIADGPRDGATEPGSVWGV